MEAMRNFSSQSVVLADDFLAMGVERPPRDEAGGGSGGGEKESVAPPPPTIILSSGDLS